MVAYRRIYEDTIKRYAIDKGIVGVSLIFVMFMLMASRGDITITGYSNDTKCAGTDYDPCYAYLNFTANTDIYIYPNDNLTWAFNTRPENLMDRIIMQRSWGTGWRTINLSKTWTYKTKYAIKFSKGKDYQLRFIGYKNNISDTVKWGFGFADGDYDTDTESYVDPVWEGYASDDFFVELVDYNADLTKGYAEFVFNNPLNKDIEITNETLRSLYTVLRGELLNEQYSFYSDVKEKTVKVNKTTCVDNYTAEDINGTPINNPICTASKVDKVIPKHKVKNKLEKITVKKSHNITMRIDLTYEPNTIVDWIPEFEIEAVKFKQEKW